MTADFWSSVWDVLMREAGATEHYRGDFIRGMTTRREPAPYRVNPNPDEYRFMGTLGFGGKVWTYFGHGDGAAVTRLRINCYPEDETPERMETIRRTNAALAALLSPTEVTT